MTKKYKINLLDLFSGIGGFHLGLEKAGFKVNSYFSEIDKYAIQVYKHNFKNSTYVKSVTDVQQKNLPKIDAITFGSPCQDFSVAGKGKGMQGSRSSLISEAIRLISECRPSFFIWENVKGTFSSNNGQDFWAIIQAFANIGGYRLEWQLLNTKWFLPQNRERIYLVGYAPNGSGGQVFPIKESSSKVNELQRQQANTCTLTGRYNAKGNGSYIIERKLNAQIAAQRGRNLDNPSNRKKGIELTQRLEINKEAISNTLTSVQKDNYVVGTLRTHNDGKGFRKVVGTDYPTIPSRAREDVSGQPIIGNQQTIRRLTPIECERLQGFPDNWTYANGISDSQRYKMIGNAVTVDVVEAVGQRIKNLLYE
jgi:DNA (cytosine-5)-methyltransferase 1